jgi:hypothetical protein
MAKTFDEKFAAKKALREQIDKEMQEMLQEQKAKERKERNHRLCKRGGKVEKLLPTLAVLTEEQFEIFVQKTLLTPHTKRILAELVPPTPAPAVGAQDNTDRTQAGESAKIKPSEEMPAAG